jgi:hypothetical protein
LSDYAVRVCSIILVSAGIFASGARAQSDDQELAKKLSNPIASLISVPLQLNFDRGIGQLERGKKWTLNIQPVIPFTLNADWNLISRTIVPVVSQNDILNPFGIFPGSGNQSGLGDITQSLFFSPSQPSAGGIIWGIGPVLVLPSGTDPLLSGRQWAAGPTAVALTQFSGFTVGVLANHVWSFAKTESDARQISQSFVQPFVSYTTRDAWTFTLNAESTYNWRTDQFTVPINFSVSKLLKFGAQPVSLSAGVGYYAVSPQGGPQGFRGRLVMTFLFPK